MAILYQLPNGKCVYLSVEQLLHLNDADIQYMVGNDMGYESNNPHRKLKYADDESTPENQLEYKQNLDNSPDMLSDGDDDPYDPTDINNIPDS